MKKDLAQEHRYSTFALDVHWSSGRPPDVDLAKHLENCERCQAYLDELSALESAGGPSWPLNSSPRRIGTLGRRFVGGAAALVMVVAALFLVIHQRDAMEDSSGYVGIKGAPAVQVLIQRNEHVEIWDGSAAVHAGDALALRVACDGFAHVAVASPAPAQGNWVRLADAACPFDDTPLPFTLLVDDQPGDEQLAVVLSATRLDDHSLHEAIRQSSRTSDAWVLPLAFAKTTREP